MLKRLAKTDRKFALFFVSLFLTAVLGFSFFYFVQEESNDDLTRFLFAGLLLSLGIFLFTMKHGSRRIVKFLVALGGRK